MKVLIYFFTGVLLLTTSIAGSQTTSNASTTPANDSDNNSSFPENWVGTWEGELMISNAKGVAQRIPMSLEILPTEKDSIYTWNIIYGEDREKGLRAYVLKILDREKGHYLVDELNTIALESYLFGDRLFCWYLVAGTYILVIYEKKGEALHFEIVAGKEAPASVTGNAKHNGEDIPEVKTFPVTTVQQAILRKKN